MQAGKLNEPHGNTFTRVRDLQNAAQTRGCAAVTAVFVCVGQNNSAGAIQNREATFKYI